MTLPEVNAYFAAWRDVPPTHIAVGAILGAFSAKPEISESDIAEVGRVMPVLRGRDPGLPTTSPILDLDAMREKNRQRAIAKARRA